MLGGSMGSLRMKPFAVALILLIVAGCNTNPAREATLRAQAAQPVTCNTDHDCWIKWDRAVAWAQTHSAGVRSSDSWQIKVRRRRDSSPTFTITRIANPEGGYTLEFDAHCSHWLGCDPTILEEKASFVQYMMGTE